MVDEYKFYSQYLKIRDHVGELNIKSVTIRKWIHKEEYVQLNCIHLAQLASSDALL
jgi:hypothetical protein